MIVEFKGFLSKLDYDILKVEMQYLKDNYNIDYTLTLDKLIVKNANNDFIEFIKDFLKLDYKEYLKRGAI
jgi:hypothetical protein